jgi:hypothetical protein
MTIEKANCGGYRATYKGMSAWHNDRMALVALVLSLEYGA